MVTQTAVAPDPAITVDARTASGSVRTVLGTQFVWPGGLSTAAARTRFDALSPPVVRINATTVGVPALPLVLPAGLTRGDWDFRNLDSIVHDVRLEGGQVLLTIAYAPQWMWSCPAGAIRDPTFGEFADYMARLVSYYNRGSFVAEDGTTIVNPSATENRITSWELWNEPDQPTMGCPPAGNPNISAREYLTMWNAASARMLAIDPSIRLVGPATSAAITLRVPDYLPTLLAGAVHRPDVVSFHAYGGWKNSQTDQFLFDGQGGCCGLVGMLRGLAQIRAWAPGIPVWITELNVNSAYDADDPAGRPWSALSVAWGASAFRQLAVAGVDAVLEYAFVHPRLRQFSLVDSKSGDPFLPYWRDFYLGRYFPAGSEILPATSPVDDVEVLAARPPGSRSINVLLINRRVDPGVVGGPGMPVTVRISLAADDTPERGTLRVIDANTPLASGPASTEVTIDREMAVTLPGYGVALLEFGSGSARSGRDAAVASR